MNEKKWSKNEAIDKLTEFNAYNAFTFDGNQWLSSPFVVSSTSEYSTGDAVCYIQKEGQRRRCFGLVHSCTREEVRLKTANGDIVKIPVEDCTLLPKPVTKQKSIK